MQLPCIHLNGTSKEGLLGPLCQASEKLEDALKAIRETGPNGRDYYPLGPAAFTLADNEHVARLKKVDEVRREIIALIEGIEELP